MTTPNKHSNRRNFEGILARLDLPSDRAPGGARGHRILVPVAVAVEALPSLLGMPVGFGSCWGIHNYRQRCGVINEAEIVCDELQVRGHLWCKDFPEIAPMMAKGKLGMSFELDDAHIKDMREPIWEITKLTFRGAAILFAEKAAYKTTRVNLAAGASGQGFCDDIDCLPVEVEILRFIDEAEAASGEDSR
jgi:hypothetical protein